MSDTLSESHFEKLADRTLLELVEALGALDELDADLAQGVLTIKFEDGKRYVVNSHRAARQIWAAADASAWHFDWNGSRWVSTKTQEELVGLVEGLVSRRLGRTISLRA